MIEAAPAIARGLPLGATQRIIPGVIEIQEWPKSGWVLLWKHYDELRGKYPRQVESDDGILAAFIRLENATPEQVRSFAQRHGVLDLCDRHGLPYQHGAAPYPAGEQSLSRGCRLAHREEIARWLAFAGFAAAVWRISHNLHSGAQTDAADWHTLNAWSSWSESTVPLNPGGRRAVLANAVQLWVRLGNLRPQFCWTDPEGSPEIVLSGTGTFGAIARQLLAAATHPGHTGAPRLEVCTGCGNPYPHEGKRRPRRDRGTFCSVCKRMNVGKRLRNERHRRKKAERAAGTTD